MAIKVRAFDAWYEEESQGFCHPVDPFHRVEVRSSSRHIVIRHHGRTVAETRSPLLVVETDLPERWYLPREDVDWSRLTPSEVETCCAYKGTARYWTAGDDVLLAWSYEAPRPEVAELANLVCFFDERVDETVVDGLAVPPPTTPWST